MFGRITPMVRTILIINIGIFVMTLIVGSSQFNINNFLALYKLDSPLFAPYQLFTYMFAHGGFMHVLFNMIGLIVFGAFLEQFWGSNKFLIFYLGTGIGAALIYSGVNYVGNASFSSKIADYYSAPNPDKFNSIIVKNAKFAHAQLYEFISEYSEHPENESLIRQSQIYLEELAELRQRGSMVGASGAVYGLLMACALLFPNLQVQLLFPPIPIRMKYLALFLGGMAIYSSIKDDPGDNVAHLAHLGGMIFAYIMIMFWRRQGKDYS